MSHKKEKQPTAGEVLVKQHADILASIEILQKQAELIEDNTNPEAATWITVSEHAAAADQARSLIRWNEECNS